MLVDVNNHDEILASIHLPRLAQTGARKSTSSAAWWHEAVIYQIYLKSFADSNGDGVGDIDGVIARLPYLQSLGVDAIWISPWYCSPMRDGGYDVANYFDIDPSFGSLANAKALIDECHRLGMKIITDMVANHCSDQHPWFQAALSSPRNSPERAMFYFKDGQGDDGSEPPNDWKSIFGGPAWTRTIEPDGPGQWYLNIFDSSQPDLNWHNEVVRRHFDDILRFWFDLGVDGFRLDAIAAVGKDDDFSDAGFGPDDIFRPDLWKTVPFFDASGVHEVLRRWRGIAEEYVEEKFLVGEVVVHDRTRLAKYLRNDELHSTLSFEMSKLPWDANAFMEMAATLQGATFEGHSWVTWTLASHDECRSVTRLSRLGDGHDDEAIGRQRARSAYLLVLALPGSACIFQGEELGLSEVLDLPSDKLQDPIYFRTKNRLLGRDGCRVPLPWTEQGPTFGFSAGANAWLPQPEKWGEFSVESETLDPTSSLAFFRALVKARHELLDAQSWSVEWLEAPDGVVHLRRDNLDCVVNFSGEPWTIPSGWRVVVSTNASATLATLKVNEGVWLTREP